MDISSYRVASLQKKMEGFILKWKNQKRDFSIISVGPSVRLSVRSLRIALFVNLDVLELFYLFQTFRDYSFSSLDLIEGEATL